MVRPLSVILARIARRKQRIENMIAWGIDQTAIDFEQRVVDSLSAEYRTRVDRLNLYMGIV